MPQKPQKQSHSTLFAQFQLAHLLAKSRRLIYLVYAGHMPNFGHFKKPLDPCWVANFRWDLLVKISQAETVQIRLHCFLPEIVSQAAVGKMLILDSNQKVFARWVLFQRLPDNLTRSCHLSHWLLIEGWRQGRDTCLTPSDDPWKAILIMSLPRKMMWKKKESLAIINWSNT